MSADTDDIDDESPADGRKVRLLTLGDLDGRTNAAKCARALIADLENDLGGADRLTAAQRTVVRRAAVAAAMLEHMAARWLSGHGVDLAGYCALTNVERRLLTTLGLERKQRDVTPDLGQYLAAKASERASEPHTAAKPVTVLPPPY